MSTLKLQITRKAEELEVTRKMFKILEDLLQTPRLISPQIAASWINDLHSKYRAERLKARHKSDFPESSVVENQNAEKAKGQNSEGTDDCPTDKFLCEFWDLVWAVVAQIPVYNFAQEVLAALVRCIRELANPATLTDNGLLWKDLPRIERAGRDLFKGMWKPDPRKQVN